MFIIPPILIYFIFLIIFFIFRKIKRYADLNKELKISIIVAAKNEEEKLNILVESLSSQDYSNENYEVIIVDDNSNDSTYNKALELTRGKDNFRVLKSDNAKFIGKRGALQIGVENSKNQFLVFTDADCRPNKEFVKAYSSMFHNNFDLAFGIAPLYQTNSILNKLICYDNLWVHILSFSFANIGLPYSAAGRSFGIKKDSFLNIDGYKSTTDTLSGDDDLLLREAIKANLTIGIVTSNEAFVFSNAKESFKDFIFQRSRHTSTSNYYSVKIRILLGIWHILNLSMLFSPLLINIDPKLIILFLTKIIGEIFTVKMLMKKFSYHFSIIEILGLMIYREILLIVFYLNSFLRKNKW